MFDQRPVVDNHTISMEYDLWQHIIERHMDQDSPQLEPVIANIALCCCRYGDNELSLTYSLFRATSRHKLDAMLLQMRLEQLLQ